MLPADKKKEAWVRKQGPQTYVAWFASVVHRAKEQRECRVALLQSCAPGLPELAKPLIQLRTDSLMRCLELLALMRDACAHLGEVANDAQLSKQMRDRW